MKATYIIIKDSTKKHSETMTFKHGTSAVNCENALNYFNTLVAQGYYPVCYRKAGLFGRKRTNWDTLSWNR